MIISPSPCYRMKSFIPSSRPLSTAKTVSAERLPKQRASRQVDHPSENPGVTYSGNYIFGDSDAFRKILKQVALVAPTSYSVIIYGETGSGKESIAQEIHKRSKRSSKTFIAIDCGALSKELAASELFGHEKGVIYRRRESEESDVLNSPMAEPFSWMKLPIFLMTYRCPCCALCRKEK